LDDLHLIFMNRKHHKCVILEDDKLIETTFENLDNFVENYFIEKPIKKETAFLRHNLNIYYTKNNEGIKLGNLINEKVDQCLFFSKLSDVIFTGITLKEINQIISLSEKMTNFDVLAEDMKSETDDLGRPILKNKYRILNKYTLKFC